MTGLLQLLHDCCDYTPKAANPEHFEDFRLQYGDVAGNVLRPGEHIVALSVRPGRINNTVLPKFDAALPRFAVRGCYCSVLDRCWVSDLRGLDPKPVAKCPAVAPSFGSDTHGMPR